MEEDSVLDKFMNVQESLVVQQSDFSMKTIAEMVDSGAINMNL